MFFINGFLVSEEIVKKSQNNIAILSKRVKAIDPGTNPEV